MDNADQRRTGQLSYSTPGVTSPSIVAASSLELQSDPKLLGPNEAARFASLLMGPTSLTTTLTLLNIPSPYFVSVDLFSFSSISPLVKKKVSLINIVIVCLDNANVASCWLTEEQPYCGPEALFALYVPRRTFLVAMDQLLNTLRSSKLVFWEEHKGRPETEIQEAWNHRLAFLTQELGANPSSNAQPSVPQKRAVPSTYTIDGPRPSKRRGHVVGLFFRGFLTFWSDWFPRHPRLHSPSSSNVTCRPRVVRLP